MLTKELDTDINASYSTSTNEKGIIVSVSKDFETISGYTAAELKGQNHNILRHPDMPKIIFKKMWHALENGDEFIGFIFNHAKDGGYYWLANKTYLFSRDKKKGTCKYFSYKTTMSSRARFHMANLYSILLEEEKKGGIEASEAHLDEYLKFRGVSFDEYMKTFLDGGGLFKTGFFMARKLFGGGAKDE
ncbi:MAG: hypothetical protein COB07_10575 [Sulfurovum sp.]|nr:MAG: hypothetical protein COB07_10575 [Sulfurovum sp.]